MFMVFRIKVQSQSLVHIEAQAENTVREAKNRFVLSWLHFQTLKSRFRSCTLMMLRKSHTHDRIGLADNK